MFASMYVYVSGAHGGQKKASDLELEYMWLWVTLWGLGIEPWSSRGVANALTTEPSL